VRGEIVQAPASESELGMGLKFLELGADDAERIRKFVAARP
jgi:hypothetical protein